MTGADMAAVRPIVRNYDVFADFSDPIATWHRFLEIVNRTQGLTILGTQHHLFPPVNGVSGITGMVILSESHAAIHTWPEHNYASITLSSCSGYDSVLDFERNLAQVWPNFRGAFHDESLPDAILAATTVGPIQGGHSRYQRWEFFETVPFGKAMGLDGVFQATELDEFVYHELLAVLPTLFHPNPVEALLIGGGDGFAAQALLRFTPVQRVTQVDIDGEVVQRAMEWFGTDHLLQDPRFELIIADCMEYLKAPDRQFDLAVVDLTDPFDETVAAPTQSPEFYRMLKQALRPQGILAQQIGSPWFQTFQPRSAIGFSRRLFQEVRTYWGSIPSFGGAYLFLMASDLPLKRLREPHPELRYLSPEMADAVFVLPPVFRANLDLDSEAPETRSQVASSWTSVAENAP